MDVVNFPRFPRFRFPRFPVVPGQCRPALHADVSPHERRLSLLASIPVLSATASAGSRSNSAPLLVPRRVTGCPCLAADCPRWSTAVMLLIPVPPCSPPPILCPLWRRPNSISRRSEPGACGSTLFGIGRGSISPVPRTARLVLADK
jgi:hypothetical protein